MLFYLQGAVLWFSSLGYIKGGELLCLSLRPEGNNIIVELCIKALRRCCKAYSFSFFFFFLVGLLIGAAFNPLVFAEVMRLWQ